MLALRPGTPARQTHDYKRHATTSLFAAPEITNERIRRGSHRSTRESGQAVDDYPAVYNGDPNPFIRTKSADDIPASLQGCRTGMIEAGY